MVSREDIAERVRDDVEVRETGGWYIAIGSYDGVETARQSELSRERAIEKLVEYFYRCEKEQKRNERLVEELKGNIEARFGGNK